MDVLHKRIIKRIKKGKLDEAEKLLIEFQNSKRNKKYYDRCLDILQVCICESNSKMLKMLMKYIDINYQPNNGNVFLVDFLFNNHDMIIKDDYKINKKILYMLNYVKNINQTDFGGYSVLNEYLSSFNRYDVVLVRKNMNIITKMLEIGADIFIGNLHDDNSPLSMAFCINNFNLVKILFENSTINGTKGVNNIDIDILSCAYTYEKNYDIIEFLLQYINDINALDREGNNIKDIVEKYDIVDEDIIELLKAHGARL